jgi:hypothetical protein
MIADAIKMALLRVPVINSLRRHRNASRWEPSPFGPATPSFDPSLGLFRFKGSWEQIGQLLMLACPADDAISRSRRYLNSLGKSERMKVAVDIERALDQCSRRISFLPDLLRGVAAASSASIEEAVLSACVTTLAPYAEFSRSCGAIVLKGENGILMGQSLDLGLVNTTAAALVEPHNGPAFLCHMNGGTIWFGPGINEHGVVMGGASVNAAGAFRVCPECLPHTLTSLMVLSQAKSAQHACRLIEDARPYGPPNDGESIIVADGDTIETVEITGQEFDCRAGGPAVVTNCFTSVRNAQFQANERTTSVALEMSKRRRRSAIDQLASGDLVCAESLGSFLSRTGSPETWNRIASWPDDGWTTSRYLIDTAKDTFSHWQGPDLANPLKHEIKLSTLLHRKRASGADRNADPKALGRD